MLYYVPIVVAILYYILQKSSKIVREDIVEGLIISSYLGL